MENITIPKEEYLRLLDYRRVVQLMELELHESEFKEDFVREVEEIKAKGKFTKAKSVTNFFKEIEEDV